MTVQEEANDTSATVRDLPPNAAALRDELAGKLQDFQELAKSNFLDNPVQRLAYDLIGRMQSGELGTEDMEGLVQLLTVRAFEYRAKRLSAYVGETDVDANQAAFHALVKGLTKGPVGEDLPFEDFRDRFERELFGIVFTAHPTFTVSSDLTRILAQLATGVGLDGKPLTDETRQELIDHATRAHHGRHKSLDLSAEHDFAQETIANAQQALSRIYRTILSVASEAYPERWVEMVPRLMTVASWVGYDLDGRADIRWFDTFLVRMKVEAIQLGRYLGRIDEIPAEGEMKALMARIQTRLKGALEQVDGDMDLLAGCTDVSCSGDPTADESEKLRVFSRSLSDSRETRLVDAAEIIDVINQALDLDIPDEVKTELSILRAEMANYGLDVSHLHMRLNASQIINAVRMQIGMTGSVNDPSNHRRFLREVNALLDDVEPVTINFGSLMGEITTAKRMFMVVAQFVKYVDARTPIRFLIAECDSPAAVLSALYYARLFGVEDMVDISPLFETPKAMEHGHDIVRSLLDNPHYCAYIKSRGRLCIQTGFSDAGRYIGQATASLAVERIRKKMAGIMGRRLEQIEGVELVIFDTHGESIGRGAHPVSFTDRLDYTYPPGCRAEFACNGVPVKQEVSFQGGDGYTFFATPELAFATVCRLLEHALSSIHDACQVADTSRQEDLFYEDTDFSLEFFLTVKNFNERMMDEVPYAVLLNAFGSNLLYQTGSRKVKRQHEGKASIDQSHPSQIRAIPHNAILQQMGFLANSVSGIGKAIAADQDRFVEVYNGSERTREFMSLAAYAYHLSSLDSLAAYIDLFDPVSWLRLEDNLDDEHRRDQMRRISVLVRGGKRKERLRRIFRVFLQESIDFNRGLDAIGNGNIVPKLVDECHPDLELLHATRIALIHEIFTLTSRLPRFSNLPDVTMDEVIEDLLQLDVERAVGNLKRAFPLTGDAKDEIAFGEEATYKGDAAHGYNREHYELFDPLLETYDLVRRISVGVSHVMGATG